MSVRSILIVANPYEAELVRRAAASLDLAAVVAEERQTALEAMLSHKPTLAVIGLPLVLDDGAQVVQALRASPLGPYVPLLVIGDDDPGGGASAQAMALGADDFLPRPFELPSLVARLEAHLEESRIEHRATPISPAQAAPDAGGAAASPSGTASATLARGATSDTRGGDVIEAPDAGEPPDSTAPPDLGGAAEVSSIRRTSGQRTPDQDAPDATFLLPRLLPPASSRPGDEIGSDNADLVDDTGPGDYALAGDAMPGDSIGPEDATGPGDDTGPELEAPPAWRAFTEVLAPSAAAARPEAAALDLARSPTDLVPFFSGLGTPQEGSRPGRSARLPMEPVVDFAPRRQGEVPLGPEDGGTFAREVKQAISAIEQRLFPDDATAHGVPDILPVVDEDALSDIDLDGFATDTIPGVPASQRRLRPHLRAAPGGAAAETPVDAGSSTPAAATPLPPLPTPPRGVVAASAPPRDGRTPIDYSRPGQAAADRGGSASYHPPARDPGNRDLSPVAHVRARMPSPPGTPLSLPPAASGSTTPPIGPPFLAGGSRAAAPLTPVVPESSLPMLLPPAAGGGDAVHPIDAGGAAGRQSLEPWPASEASRTPGQRLAPGGQPPPVWQTGFPDHEGVTPVIGGPRPKALSAAGGDPRPAGGRPRPPRPPLADSGPLGQFDVPTLLAALCEARFTGRLSLRRDEVEKLVFFDGGRPVAASSSEPYDRLEGLLYRLGLFGREELARLREARTDDSSLAARLAYDDLLRPEEAAAVLAQHVEEVLCSCFSWENGQYALSSQTEIPVDRIRPDTPTEALILDGIRRRVGLPRLIERVGPKHVLLTVEPDEEVLQRAQPLGDELHALPLFDGHHTLAQIGDESRLGLTRAYQLAYGLHVLGLLRLESGLPSGSGPRETEPLRRRILVKHEQAREGDYFTLLGVRPDATLYELRQTYQQLSEQLAEARRDPELAAELEREMRDIREVIDEAFVVLSDDETRQAYRQALEL